jgi:hypothetical protein
MFEYEIEVHGHYTATVTVTAETQDEAEILATEEFEREYLPYSNAHGWTDVWGWSEVEGVISSTEESEEY